MLTLKQLTALADIYGADLRRWPEAERAGVAPLLQVSPAARQVMRDAAEMDQLIQQASAADSDDDFGLGEEQAALARLRSGVSARIATPLMPGMGPSVMRAFVPAGGGMVLAQQRMARLGMMLGLALTVSAGIWIGGMPLSPAGPVDLTAVLQPAPFAGWRW